MFVFKAKIFIEELKLHNLQMAELSIASFENAQVESDFIRLNAESFGQIKGDSIDYAVMEKTTKGKVVKLNAGWDDVGSWSALYDISKKDENLNVIKGDVISFDTHHHTFAAEKMKALLTQSEKEKFFEGGGDFEKTYTKISDRSFQ